MNQIANFALLEWPDNLKVSAAPPSTYAPALDAKMTAEARFHHALPPKWWDMSHEHFLEDRRRRMAAVVKAAWEKLRGEPAGQAIVPTAAELIANGETDAVEFKSTLRTNLHTHQVDEKIQLAILKTIAAFLNVSGGTLLVGVADDGRAIGLEADAFASEDKMSLHLVSLVRDRIGDLFGPYVHPEFVDLGGTRILSVRCEGGPKPAFVKDGPTQRFYVRTANATSELSGQSVVDYVHHRWK